MSNDHVHPVFAGILETVVPDARKCSVHAAETRMKDELPCPWCAIDELKRNRDRLQAVVDQAVMRGAMRAAEASTPQASKQQLLARDQLGELWSFLRAVLSQGGDIWLDHREKSYEQYSARLDAAARERVDALAKLIAPSGETGAEGIGDMPQAQQDAEDAKRYRWLKSHIAVTIIKRINPKQIDKRAEAMDAAIDLKMCRTPTVGGDRSA